MKNISIILLVVSVFINIAFLASLGVHPPAYYFDSSKMPCPQRMDLDSNATSSFDIAIGNHANVGEGNFNLVVGTNAGSNLTNESNMIVFGDYQRKMTKQEQLAFKDAMQYLWCEEEIATSTKK